MTGNLNAHPVLLCPIIDQLHLSSRHIRESLERGQMQKMSPEERESILEGLKQNWEKLHHEYQGLSVVTDTPAKKARKERMEAEMKQLEKDIELIERHPVIYIGNTEQ